MENKWLDSDVCGYKDLYGTDWGEDLAERTYSSRLIGAESNLVLHGGGNSSVKSTYTDILGEAHPVIYVKASGKDMAHVDPDDHPGVDLTYLQRLRSVPDISDSAMVNEIRTHMIDAQSPTPSIETLMHAFIPPKYVDHTHADAILALTNQVDGETLVREALGDDVIIVGYVKAGFQLAKVSADAYDSNPNAKAMVLMNHGIVTWGDTAKESYDAMIHYVTLAEDYISGHAVKVLVPEISVSVDEAWERVDAVVPILRGVLTPRSADADKAFDRMIMIPLVNQEVLDLIDCERAGEIVTTPPLTADHLIRTKSLPMWVEPLNYADMCATRSALVAARDAYMSDYNAYIDRHSGSMPNSLSPFDPIPRVIIIKGVGVFCVGADVESAVIARDIAVHTLHVKKMIAEMGGTYRGLSEDHIFEMEYYTLQHAKLDGAPKKPLNGETAVVTGAAGAIGSGICRGLLDNGCNVAVTDLAGENLNSLVAELKTDYGDRVAGIPIDVTNPDSVLDGIRRISRIWGGLDIAVINAGIAYVSTIKDMDISMFQRLERINIEGTLNMLKALAAHFEMQGIGGNIIITSTKNVFSPGNSFGAYSATKAASHQLGRVASLELAPIGVRVNMVAPDAVFSAGPRKSGLWQEVGPSRMRSRGLDEDGLEEYYQSRNLLKARVTADHVANAVIFFAARQTPTTGATIPVDGGLPDATPR